MIKGTEHFAGMVINFLLRNLTVPPQDIIVITSAKNESRVNELKSLNLSVRTGVDYNNRDSLRKAFAGIKRLLIIRTPEMRLYSCPFGPFTLAQIAADAGVKHIVYIQTLFDSNKLQLKTISKMKKYLENRQNITHTILKESPTYETLMDFSIECFLREGNYYTQNKSATVSHVSMADSALVAATVLASNKFENEIFDVTGPRSLTREQVSQVVSEVLGVNMTVMEVTVEALIDNYLHIGYSEVSARYMTLLDNAYVQGMWSRVGTAVKSLTPKDSEPFREWLIKHKTRYLFPNQSVSIKH